MGYSITGGFREKVVARVGLEVWSVLRGVGKRAVARWAGEQPKLRTGVRNTLGSGLQV